MTFGELLSPSAGIFLTVGGTVFRGYIRVLLLKLRVYFGKPACCQPTTLPRRMAKVGSASARSRTFPSWPSSRCLTVLGFSGF